MRTQDNSKYFSYAAIEFDECPIETQMHFKKFIFSNKKKSFTSFVEENISTKYLAKNKKIYPTNSVNFS